MAMNRLALRAVPGTRRTPPAQVQGGNSTLTPPSLSKLPGSELGGGGLTGTHAPMLYPVAL